jgi:hypothetical protein
MYCAIISGLFVGLVVYIIYLWNKANQNETARLYRWLDDILDRIAAGDAEKYAFVYRIKYDILEKQEKKIREEEEVEKAPPLFTQQRR